MLYRLRDIYYLITKRKEDTRLMCRHGSALFCTTIEPSEHVFILSTPTNTAYIQSSHPHQTLSLATPNGIALKTKTEFESAASSLPLYWPPKPHTDFDISRGDI